MDDTIKKKIIDELGLGALKADDQDDALERVGVLIFQSVLVRVVDELDEAGKSELEHILTSSPNDGEAVLKFLTDKVPNFDQIIREEVMKFKEEASLVMGGKKQS